MRRRATNILAPLLLVACLVHPVAAEEFWLSAALELDPAQQYQNPVFQLQDLRDQTTVDLPARLLRQDRIADNTADFQICSAIELRGSGSFRVVAQLTDDAGKKLTFPVHDRRDFDFSRIDVVLVIDASASMRETDPDNLRITAVRRFIELARHSERIANIALVSFQTESELLLSLTPPNEIDNLEKYLRRLKPSASTNFDKAFNNAHDVLKRSKEARQAVLFLSDGSVKKYRETHRKFNQLAAPVHSIGLSDEADKQLLSRIAGESNGQFFDAPTADQLNGIFVQVFHLLDEPDVVARRIHAIPGDRDFEFHIDPTMDNVIVRLVPVSGRHAARFNGEMLYGQDNPKLTDYAVPDKLKGLQRIEFDGDGKSGCEIIAATVLKLRTVQLVREAPVGTDLEAWTCLLGRRLCESVETVCELRKPDGTTTAIRPMPPNAGGFTRINVPTTQMPGQYRLEIQVTGTVDGQTFARTTALYYDRHGTADVLSSDMDRVGPELRPIEEELETDRLFDTTSVEVENIEASSLTTTYWASTEALAIGPLYPGQSGEATVEVQISSVSSESLQAWLEQTSAPGITLQLDGDVRKNRRIALTVQAAADRVSAGRQFTTAVALSLGDLEWRIPLHVTVAAPRIVATLSDSQITENPRAIEVSAVLQIALDPAGEGDLQISTDIAGLQIDTPKLAATTLPVPVRLGMRLAVPLVRNEWTGTITITGERLEPVEVPYRIEIDRQIEPIGDYDSGAKLADIATSQYTWWWLLVLFAVLLVSIILAAVRGNRRAIFLLASLAIHAAVLLLVMPRVNPNKEDQAKAPVVTTMTISSNDHVHEERIKSEVAEFEAEKETPDEAEAAKQKIEIEDEVTDETQELEVEETLEPTEMTEELEAAEALERQDLEVEQIETEVEEVERVQEVFEETEADEQTPTEVEIAEAEITPEQEDAKELEVEETLTEPEETADTRELEMELERQDIKVEKLETEAVEIERMQSAAATEIAAARVPTVVEVATAEAEAATDAAQDVEVTKVTLVETIVTATGQTIELEVERQSVEATMLETQITAVERKQAAAGPAAIKQAVQSSQTATTVQLPDTSTAARQMTVAETPVDITSETRPTIRNVATGVTREGIETEELLTQLTTAERKSHRVALVEVKAAAARRVKLVAHQANAAELATTAAVFAPAAMTTTTPVEPGAPQNVITPIAPEGATAPVDLAAAPTVAPRRKAVPVAPSAGARARAIAGAAAPDAAASATVAQDTSDASRRLDIAGKAPPAADAARPAATLQDLGTAASKAPQRPSTAATAAGKLPPSTVAVPARRRATAAGSIPDDDLGAQARIGNPLVGAKLAFPDPSDVHQFAIDSTLPPVDFDFAPPALIPPLQVFVGGPGQRRTGGSNLVPLVQYSGDWDCDRTAMVNLADQLERRTGSIAPFSSNVVKLDSDEVHDTPFIFMTGHNDFQFTGGEVKRLREYLKGGGYLWINDSTHEGEERYDIAVRREMKRVFDDIEMTRVPKESNLFKGPYDLTKGYKGYKYVLPGDKYRQDYLEQLIVDGRPAVIYTRNDYGDGLEIDPKTHPLMGSLTDLSPAEMQESSVRMGINIVMFFYSKGGTPDDTLKAAIAGSTETAEAEQWTGKQEIPFPLLRLDRRWQVPEGWEGLLSARPVYRNDNGIIVDFRQNPVRSTNGSEKAVIEAFVDDLQIANDRVMLIDVKSSLGSGARLAIALIGKGEDSYVESSPAFIRPGKNDNVSFDFRAGTFKTLNSNWEYKATVPIPYEMANWFFIVYPMEASGKVEINNVRMIKP